MTDKYILDGKTAVRESDLMKWGAWMETNSRTVRKDAIGEARVSTVFLGLDHDFGGGPPLLFETMVFGGPLDQEQARCSTWEAAEKMHELMCKAVRDCAEQEPKQSCDHAAAKGGRKCPTCSVTLWDAGD